MLDIELLDATFGGLNFSIAGNMRAGIFIKDILDRDSCDTYKTASRANKIKTGKIRCARLFRLRFFTSQATESWQ